MSMALVGVLVFGSVDLTALSKTIVEEESEFEVEESAEENIPEGEITESEESEHLLLGEKEGWEYDEASNTLTLTDYVGTTVVTTENGTVQIFSEDDLNIVLNGENTLSAVSDYGIYCEGELTISGTGSLDITNVTTAIIASRTVISEGELFIDSAEYGFCLNGEECEAEFTGGKSQIYGEIQAIKAENVIFDDMILAAGSSEDNVLVKNEYDGEQYVEIYSGEEDIGWEEEYEENDSGEQAAEEETDEEIEGTEETEEIEEIEETEETELTVQVSNEEKGIESFNVFFDANGGNLNDVNCIVFYGETYGVLPVPNRTGYHFDGWFTDLTDGQLITADAEVDLSDDITVYAHWTKIHNLIFELEGGTFSKMDSTVYEITDGGTANEALSDVYTELGMDGMEEPVLAGYEFAGWVDSEGNAYDFDAQLTEDTYVYAQWVYKEVYAPVSNIESGSKIYEDAVIRLSSMTLDAKIYYTTDGTEPSADEENPNGKLYTDGIKVRKVMLDSDDPESNDKVVTIKAYAVKVGSTDSEVVTFEYIVESQDYEWGDVIEADRALYATEDMPEGDASLVPSGMWVAGINDNGYTYSGYNITFLPGTENEIRVYEGKKLLKLNQDYTISYKNNRNAYQLREGDEGYKASKAPTVIMTGKGNYSGSITKTFVINPVDLSALNADGTAMFKAPDIILAYNGKVQKGTTKVTYTNADGKTTVLKVKKDFTYTYPGTDKKAADYAATAFKDASETPYVVTITGKGNYTGTLTFHEKITSRVLISKVKVSSIPAQNYNAGEVLEPAITLKYKGKVLSEYDEVTGTGDYTLRYENNNKPGTASVIITGKGDYEGTRTVTFKINGINLKKAKMEGYQSSYIYTGDEIKQENVRFSYTVGSGEDAEVIELKENVHYTVTYTKNDKVGTATVVYTGINDNGWTGTIKKTFKIKAYDLNSDTENRITVTDGEGKEYPQALSYVKGGVKPSPVVKYTSPEKKEYILVEGVDYKLSYLNNKALNDGTNIKKMPTIKIVGKGNFKGTRQKETFTITGSDISRLSMTASDKVYKNKKGNFSTAVVITDTDGKKLKAGTDYEKTFKYYYYESVELADGTQKEAGTEVDSKDIVPVGAVLEVVVTGKGTYAGDGESPATISGLYRIVSADISKASVKVNKQYYTGKEVCPDKTQIVITLNGKVLKAQDYEIVSYTNNINKGKAKVTVRGVGNYGGSKTVNFTIANKSMYYMISFNANGATSGSMNDLRIKYDKSYTLTKNAYKKRGYTFIGWNTDSDGSGTDAEGNVILYEDKAKNPITIGKDDIGKTLILYAQWEMTNFSITYKLNGGINHELNPSTYTIEDEVVLQEPTREGYTFLGWYTDSKFSASKKITSIPKGSVGNKVLYAKWRTSMIAKVDVPEEYLDVRDFGAIPDDATDDTDAIEKAIKQASANASNGEINTVYVPAGTYRITPGDSNNDGEPGISLKSNVNLVMDNNAVLNVLGTSLANYCVISAKNVENITVTGGKIMGERYRHSGSSGEYGHGIAIYGGKNIEISSVSVSSNWGDGIYLGTQAVKQADGSQRYVGCDNITIQDCDIFDNRRSNISVTDADNLTIDHCFIFDAHGTAPQCGICIEPNSNSSGDKICRNIILKDTTINAYENRNAPEYMCFMTNYNPYDSSYVTADGIWFKNCKFNGYVGNYSGNNLHVDSNTVFNGTFVNMR